MNRKYFPLVIGLLAMTSACSCGGNKTGATEETSDTAAVAVRDTAVYGRCSDGTMMHTLEIVTDEGRTMQFAIDEQAGSDVQGGMFVGDRMAVTYTAGEDGFVAGKVINLTSMMGRWISLDRSFTLCEDGNVESDLKVETRPYTVWTSVNGNIVLNTDTFSVLSLGADSLALESGNGVFVYKRDKRKTVK